jgi:hypothetical protein
MLKPRKKLGPEIYFLLELLDEKIIIIHMMQALLPAMVQKARIS